jgi:hypothetical protein
MGSGVVVAHVKNTLIVILNNNAKVAQLVEYYLAKVGVASSNLVFRSRNKTRGIGAWLI